MAPVKLKYIVSFTSQDENHRASNLILGNGIKRWLCHPKDRSGKIEIVMQLEEATEFAYIDIGTFWCARLEIRVGRSDWPANAEFKTLVPMVTLMSPIDCQLGRKHSSTQMFTKNHFPNTVGDDKWDRIQIICHQPYRKDMQSGISFIRIRNAGQNQTSESHASSKRSDANGKISPQRKNISEIQKHFFRGAKENNCDDTDSLKHKLLKISSSSDNGCDNLHDDALSRTAKLVLNASEITRKSNAHYNILSNQCNRGLFSDRVINRTGMTIEEEISAFFPTLNLSSIDIDLITIADLRHKYEKKKKRKLSFEEKRKFSELCHEFIWNMSENGSTNVKDRASAGNPSSLPSLLPINKSAAGNVHDSLLGKQTISSPNFSSPPPLRAISKSKGRHLIKLSPAAIMRKKNNELHEAHQDQSPRSLNDDAALMKRAKEEKDDCGSDIHYDSDSNSEDEHDDDSSIIIDDSSPTKKQVKRKLQTLEDVNNSYKDLYKTFSPPVAKLCQQKQNMTPPSKKKKLNKNSRKLMKMFDCEVSDSKEGKTNSPLSNGWLCTTKNNNNKISTNPKSNINSDNPSGKVNRSLVMLPEKSGSLAAISEMAANSMSGKKHKSRQNDIASCSFQINSNSSSSTSWNSLQKDHKTSTGNHSSSSMEEASSGGSSVCKTCKLYIPQDIFAAHITVCRSSLSQKGISKASSSVMKTSNQKKPTASSDLQIFPSCPICFKQFPQEVLMVHASECGL